MSTDPRRIPPAARPLPPVTLGPVDFSSPPNDILDAIFRDLFAFRRRVDNGDLLKAKGLKVVHIHPTPDPSDPLAVTHHTTIVYRPRYQNSHTLEYAAAICSPHDTFSKRVGLQKALARWDAGKTALLPPRQGELNDFQLLHSYFG